MEAAFTLARIKASTPGTPVGLPGGDICCPLRIEKHRVITARQATLNKAAEFNVILIKPSIRFISYC
jgi:hypothetical protein